MILLLNSLHYDICFYFFYCHFLQSFRGAPQGVNLSLINDDLGGGVDILRQVEAKYPALLFKQQLTAYVEKIYGMIRDNLKKEISPLLGKCIQVLVNSCLLLTFVGNFPLEAYVRFCSLLQN